MPFRKLSAPLEDTRFSDPQGRQCTAIRNNCWKSVVNVATLSSSVAASGARCRRTSGPAEIPFPAGGYKGPDIRRRMRSFALGLRRVRNEGHGPPSRGLSCSSIRRVSAFCCDRHRIAEVPLRRKSEQTSVGSLKVLSVSLVRLRALSTWSAVGLATLATFRLAFGVTRSHLLLLLTAARPL
jgi:hypothetical protein